MKIAFVHDRLVNRGGAEKVFFDLIEASLKKYPDADKEIFVLFYHGQEDYIVVKNTKIKINYVFKTTEVGKIDFGFFSIDYRNLMPIFPFLVYILSRKLREYGADKVVISSFAVAKNIDMINSNKDSILYLHSPMQYIWEMYDEYLGKFGFIKRNIYKIVTYYLRKWDLYKSKYIDKNCKVVANSFYTKQVASRIYNWDNISISRPKIDKVFLTFDEQYEILDYFVYIGRIVKFAKELDKIIELFNYTGDNLVIIGGGPDKEYLQSKANANIIFIDYIDDKRKLKNILSRSRGLINITKESFGIVTAEALSLGVPIFGFAGGATVELCIEGDIKDMGNFVFTQNGVFVKNKNINTLVSGFKVFKNFSFDRKLIRDNFLKRYKSFDFCSQISKII